MVIETFTPDIPVATQSLGNTVVAINNNFANYSGLISVNHGAPNSSNQGKHNFVEMPVQGTPPVTLTGEGGLFTKLLNGNSELYFQRDGDPINYQMTGPLLATASGYTILFGGIIIQWDQVSAVQGGTSKNFPIPFPNNFFAAAIAPIANNSGVVARLTANPSKTAINIGTNGGNFGVYYIAIGN